MTEQEKSSAVVEETRENVDTPPQPVVAEKKVKQYRAGPECCGYCHCTGGRRWALWLG